MNIGTIYVTSIEAPHSLANNESFRVLATYEMGGTLGSVSFDVPIAEAKNFYIGKALNLSITEVTA